MQIVWNSNRLILFSTLLLILFHPALCETASNITCGLAGVTCDSNNNVLSIDLRNQMLTGSLPNISNLASLTAVYFDSNQFTEVPKGCLSGLTNLQVFSIDNNPIGTWDAFSDLMNGSKQLTIFSAHNTSLTGPIPDIIGSFPSLKELHLSYNKFQGQVPASLASSSLQSLWLNNQAKPGMQGTIDFIASMSSLTEVWLHVNNFSGQIPDLSNCTQLVDLKLRDNLFTGAIPQTLANLTLLQNLTLKGNQLTGTIPPSLANLTALKEFDVSSNPKLSGPLPAFNRSVTVTVSITGTGVTTTTSTVIGSPPSGETPSSGAINPPPGTGSGAKSSGLSPWAIALIVVVVIIAAAIGFWVYKRCKNKDSPYKRPHLSDSSAYTSGILGGSQKISSQVSINISDGGIQMDLLIEVTDNFSDANVIGRGGFGTVYRATLPDGTEVAVKRMVAPVLMSSKGLNEYKAEIEVLSKVRHRNLVGLIGFCANGNERLLVYEFMPQGTLGDHLFDWRKRGGRPLTWSQRAAIALDVARGVDYLHTMTEQSFIHRDLKPNNILLGNDMRAKVADFGLVKNATNVGESIQTKVAGTFGYFAPEYWETGRVTTRADVYAFGVILMEIISGRKVVDDSPDAIDGGNLMLRFRRILAGKEDVRDHIDPALQADDDEETYKSICKVVELAGHCTMSELHRRCDMRHAVFILTSLVEQWTPSNSDVSTSFGVPNMPLPSLVEEWKAGNGMPSASYTSSYTYT